MRVLVYPADQSGCGYHRLIWLSRMLKRAGHDIQIMMPDSRELVLDIDERTDQVVGVNLPECDVIVMQRTAHRYISSAISAIRERGIAVVVDVDDNLNEIHPKNPAYAMLDPANEGRRLSDGSRHMQSWKHLNRACQLATLVTVSTPALIPVYGRFGNARVLFNSLVDHYFHQEHDDSDMIGWPASLASHPTDPSVCGHAIAELVADGADFRVIGYADGCGRAFKLKEDPPGLDFIPVHDWPAEIAAIGIGITPAVSSVFNSAKSWLKPLELSAVGVPWVASPIPEYQRLHEEGAGVLARSAAEWHSRLTELIKSPGWREELAGKGREVAEQHRLRNHAWRWWEAWEEARRIEDQAH